MGLDHDDRLDRPATSKSRIPRADEHRPPVVYRSMSLKKHKAQYFYETSQSRAWVTLIVKDRGRQYVETMRG